ncbi:alpha/beta fold hydrolase [Curtobacterium sp. MCBD17_019]|uniref:alpha/beta fold hydrolase n=1 Tax=Curtobacterium sp. MCBD17_019 TaxID=2175669 RepID=UPI000DAA2710|nr:alpha/beta fold hydrolase [Curtobacterium sp. MCBD17_019]PZE78272.1 alpha/beta hydrolase [Curtobacterium sp. MCBD17_019]
MGRVHRLQTVPPFGDLPTPDGVDVVGVDLPVGRLTAYRGLPDGPSRGSVLLVPGFTGSKEDFRPLVPLLRDAGWSVLAMSRRGQGDSAAPADPAAYTLDEEAADVVRVAALVDDGAPVHLLGHSLGGVIARAAAVASPSAFRSVTMLCSGPHGWPNRMFLARRLAAEQGNRALFDAQNPIAIGVADAALDQATRFARMRMDRSSTVGITTTAAILELADDTTAALRDTGLPTLVAHGEDDAAWPQVWQHDMAERLGARYAVIPDSAHSPAIEAPEATARLLDGFLADA